MNRLSQNIAFLSFLFIGWNASACHDFKEHLLFEVDIDTPEFDLHIMDSLYSEPNSNEYRVKIVFPFVWAADLNSNNYLEFSEFQQVKSVYTVGERLSFAVNYELVDSADLDLSINFNILSQKNGSVICAMKQDLNSNLTGNNLSYFFLSKEDSELNEKANIQVLKPLDSLFIMPGTYIYQAYLENRTTKERLGGNYDSLMVIDSAVVSKPTLLHKEIDNLKDLKAHKKAQIEAVENDSTKSEKEIKEGKKAIKSDYKAGKTAIKNGEKVIAKAEGLLGG
ncbi:MAG: hypothetical protein MK078_02385 [Crocinitomicaceae bacterium]|nr:hypothetical protein [Crocinitomicaceae bacterium]